MTFRKAFTVIQLGGMGRGRQHLYISRRQLSIMKDKALSRAIVAEFKLIGNVERKDGSFKCAVRESPKI
jgi:hypothetical protein